MYAPVYSTGRLTNWEVLDITPLVAHADFLRALTDYDIALTTPVA